MTTTAEKKTQLQTLDSFTHRAIAKHFKKFSKHEAEVLQDQDPECLHQMRVGIRRLRTAIQVFGFAIKLPKEASDRRLSKIAHALGAVRDLDVLQAELEAQTNLPPLEQEAVATVLKKMHKHRKQEFDELKHTLKSGRYQDLKDAFEEWLEQPDNEAIAQISILEVLPDLLLPLLSEILLHPAWFVGTTFENGSAIVHSVPPEAIHEFLAQHSLVLHDLRKQMKRIRYQTELFVDFYDTRYSDRVEEFKTIQEVLGQIQDSIVLQDYLANQLKVSLQESCPTVANQLTQKTLQAWEQWQILQKHYLDAEFRTALRLQIINTSHDKPAHAEETLN
jgi:CHAD domain-containing protein